MELLVVVGILSTLMALLLPAVQSARESSRRSSCGNNMKQLGLAALSHVTHMGHFPTGGWSKNWLGDPTKGADWRQPGGWCFTILPYFEQTVLYDRAATDLPALIRTNVPGFVCPTRRGLGLVPPRSPGVTPPSAGGASIANAGAWMHSDYAGNRGSWSSPAPSLFSDQDRVTQFMPLAGVTVPTSYPTGTSLDAFGATLQTVSGSLNVQQPVLLWSGSVTSGTVPTGGVIFAGSSTSPAMIRDGFSNTYLLTEKYVPKSDYATGTIDDRGDSQCAYVGDSPDTLRGAHRPPMPDSSAYVAGLEGCFGGPHTGVVNVVMCDGAVRQIAFDISPEIHFLLGCRADRRFAMPPD